MERKCNALVVILLVIIAIGQLSLDIMFVSLHYGRMIGEWAINVNKLSHGNLSIGSITFYILIFLLTLDIAKILRDRRKRRSDTSYTP
ncbi:MAG: hypothetical protein ACP5UZ_07255 [Thermoplasmata archaeon]